MKFFSDCARRKLGNNIFGQEFDSPHFHQQENNKPEGLNASGLFALPILSTDFRSLIEKRFISRVADLPRVQNGLGAADEQNSAGLECLEEIFIEFGLSLFREIDDDVAAENQIKAALERLWRLKSTAILISGLIANLPSVVLVKYLTLRSARMALISSAV